jgi:hypothetical protein
MDDPNVKTQEQAVAVTEVNCFKNIEDSNRD